MIIFFVLKNKPERKSTSFINREEGGVSRFNTVNIIAIYLCAIFSYGKVFILYFLR